jgi:hypothetical protein
VLEPTPAYTLAAESDPVSSNLDRLPSFPRGQKRKSEPSAQQPAPKKRGRPRLSEQRRLAAKQEADNDTVKEAPAASEANKTAEEEALTMATRRTTRRSVATKLDPLKPAKAAPTKPTSKKQRKLANDNVAVVDIQDEDTIAGHETEPVAPAVSKPSTRRAAKANISSLATSSKPSSQDAEVDLLALGLSKTNSPSARPSTEQNRYASIEEIVDEVFGATNATINGAEGSGSAPLRHFTNSSTSSAPVNGVAPPPGAAKVDLIARVHTSTGIVEIPVASNDLAAEVEVVQAYANWLEETGTPLPFEIFKSIFVRTKH